MDDLDRIFDADDLSQISGKFLQEKNEEKGKENCKKTHRRSFDNR